MDPILVRSNNGTGFSEYVRVNVNTDPVGPAALVSGLSLIDDDVPDPAAGISPQLSATKNVITFSFIDGGNQGGDGSAARTILPDYYDPASDEGQADANNTLQVLSPEQRESLRDVFDFYERVINVEFVELPYLSVSTNAEIVIGAYPIAGSSSVTFTPDLNGNGIGSPAGDIFFSTSELDFNPNTPTDVSLGSEFNLDAFQTVALALGLDFPFEPPTQLSSFSNFQYLSVLADQTDSVFNRFEPYPEATSTISLFDVQELQRLYGATTDFNNGDNQYGNFFSGSSPHFINNSEQHQTTLYDSGGNDTLNYTLHVADETIDLREGQFSSINGVQQSLRLSYGTIIENARGGSGNDNIRGNETKNFLIGNDGEDILIGGGGNDVLRGGTGNDTYIWNLGDGRDLVQELGEGGLDTLQVNDLSGALTSLEDDLTFRRFGNDLRIDFTFNQSAGQGTVTIDDFGDEASRVEFLTINDASGIQIGQTIDLQSIFDQATTLAQQFSVGTELATTIPADNAAINENAFTALAVS